MATVLLATAVLRADWITHVYGPHAIVAKADTNVVQESSGIVASRLTNDLYWTHNDSGSGPRVYAFRLNEADRAANVPKYLGYVELTGATSVDWEDIAGGPGGTIYVFDGGDNPPCNRTDKRIHRWVEPTVDLDGSPVALAATFNTTRFEYPATCDPTQPAATDAERYDAEALLVHPVTGDIYIVTKRTSGNSAAARVYKLPANEINWDTCDIHLLTLVADISPTISGLITAGDVDAFGRRVVLRDYGGAYEYLLPPGESIDIGFEQTPNLISLTGEFQGEGIAYAADGGDLITTSEVLFIGPSTCPFFAVPWHFAKDTASGFYHLR